MTQCDACAKKGTCFRHNSMQITYERGCSEFSETFITNYDRLISKTPEEMAKYIAAEQISGVRTFLNGFDQELEEEFANEVNEHWHEIVREKLDWLRQEATDAK